MAINVDPLQALEPDLVTPSGPEGGDIQASGGSPLGMILRAFAENRAAVIGVGLVVVIVLFCFVGPLVYSTNQGVPNLLVVNSRPGTNGFPLGADDSGYSILGRLMVGGRISLEVGFAVAVVTIVVGVIYGAVAGFFGKALDSVLMRIVDVLLSIPVIYLLLDLTNIVTKIDVWTMVVVLAGISWLGPARLVRGETVILKGREYVQAVSVMGGTPARIIFRHLVPNAVGVIVVQATFLIADSILILTTLQYLSLGLPATTPTWGGMLSNGTGFISAGYWWQVYPVMIIIVLTIVAFNLIGDALRDSLDVRLQQR